MTGDDEVPVTWTAGHPDPETISGYAEGLLSGPAARRVEVHLRRCGSCRDIEKALAAVRDLLSADDAGPMPPEVAARIEAALASAGEPGGVSGDTKPAGEPSAPREETGEPEPSAPVADLVRERARRRVWLLRAAAAVVVLVAGVGVVSRLVPELSSRENPASSTSKPAQAQDRANEQNARPGSPPPGRASGPVLHRGQPYAAAQFTAQVRELLRESTGQRASALPSTSSPGVLAYDEQTTRVVSCVREATGRPGDPPVVVDFGTYDGRQVAVVVLRDETNPVLLDAYVVPTACPAQPPVLVRQVAMP